MFSMSIGPPERTTYSFLYSQPNLLEYANMHQYEIRFINESVNATYRKMQKYTRLSTIFSKMIVIELICNVFPAILNKHPRVLIRETGRGELIQHFTV